MIYIRSKKEKKKGRLNFSSLLLLILSLCIAGYCVRKLYTPLNQYYLGQKENNEIRKKAVKKSKNNGPSDEKRALSRYINFDYLKRLNSDVIGWIWVPGTPIDYPILRNSDTQYYLHRNIYRHYRYSGSIFMDSVCSPDFSSDNTILYGHNMKDGSMFATLNRYGRKGFMQKHPGVYIYTPGKARMVKCYKAFSYNITLQSGTLYTDHPDSFEKYVSRARLGAQVSHAPEKKDKMLMLSTCYTGHDQYRRVLFTVHEKDVKRYK